VREFLRENDEKRDLLVTGGAWSVFVLSTTMAFRRGYTDVLTVYLWRFENLFFILLHAIVLYCVADPMFDKKSLKRV
jgi:hypothetical protein